MASDFLQARRQLVSLAVGTDGPGLSAGLPGLPGGPERQKAVNLLRYARLEARNASPC